MKKNLFFDAGNTLVLFDYARVARAITDAGFPVRPEEVTRAEYLARFDVDNWVAPFLIDRARGVPKMSQVPPYDNFIAHILSLMGVPERLHAAVGERLREEIRLLWAVVAPDTHEALKSLKRRGHRLNVISNSDGSVEGLLQELGLRGYFEHVFDSHIVGLEKPDPEFFRHAMKITDVDPAESVYFGDFYSIDYLGSRNAGMQGVLFDRADLYRHVQCARITKLSQIEQIL